MRPHDFWRLADRLFASEKNPEGFRTAIGRTYYAAFLTALEFLVAMSIVVPAGANVHVEVLTILGNTGDNALTRAQNMLMRLRDERNAADYDLTNKGVEVESNAHARLIDGYNVIAELNRCRLDAPRFAAVTAATRAWVKILRGVP